MTSTPFVQLVWKEYRAARAFWLSLIVLVVAAQAFTLWSSDDLAWNVRMICNLALAAPAFFALGCAGAAFAVEREEGTFEFLQAAPVSAGEILTSKLALAAAATLAMFVVLWLLAMAFTGGVLPESKVFSGMLGLWLLAAVEALAWATLFSLLSARPLLAIILALATTSTLVHLLAWSTLGVEAPDVFFEPYLDALPLRLVIVAVVLIADVVLGLRWLRGGAARKSRIENRTVDPQSRPTVHTDDTRFASLSATPPDRSAMIARLLWQHWRTSWKLMFLLGGLQIALTALAPATFPDDRSHQTAMFPLMGLAALAGCCVFLADQERRRYRFFVEHNIPPRWVWLTRHLSWIAVLTVSTTISGIVLMGLMAFGRLASVARVEPAWQQRWLAAWQHIDFSIFAVLVGLVLVVLAYAAGQWASMMIRSGLLAGLGGLLLAGVLFGWAFLMLLLHVSWLWSVVPIGPLLLWATWLRAPDWVRENTTWAARLRAAAVVIVPATMLLIAVPAYRVLSVPLVKPDFDLAAYQAPADPEALATGDLYRRADELYVSAEADGAYPWKALAVQRAPTTEQLSWLHENGEPLALILQASRRPSCCLWNPAGTNDLLQLRNEQALIRLLLVSGRQLEVEGKLDEAANRYFTTLRVISQWNECTPFEDYRYTETGENWVFSELVGWSARAGQTAQRVRAAVERLRGIDWQILHLTDQLRYDYVLARRFVKGDLQAEFLPGRMSPFANQLFWHRLLPWEKYRELRSLNRETNFALANLELLETQLRDSRGIIADLPESRYGWGDFLPFYTTLAIRELEADAAWQLGLFEANRRAALLRMALVGYRIEHGELPASLNDLRNEYFQELPRDPYSGLDYVYFRDGMPPPLTAPQVAALRTSIVPGEPCVWCTSGRLYAHTADDLPNEETGALFKPFVYYVAHASDGFASRLPTYTAWSRGYWFPIPKQQQ